MNEIPSPFQNLDDSKFTDEIATVVKKYGYSQFFIAYCTPYNNESGDWRGESNVISEGMIDYLEEGALPHMKEMLNEDESLS